MTSDLQRRPVLL